MENGKTGQERSERQRGARARAAACGSAKVDERRRDALDTVAVWISYPLPPWGECLFAEAATTGRDQGRPRGRQPAKAFGNGDWLANRFRNYLHTAARAHLFPGGRIDFVTVQGAVSSLGAGEP